MQDTVSWIIASRTVRVLIVVTILISITTSAFAALFSIYAKETLLLSPSLILILSTALGANALIRAPTGPGSDRIHSRRTPPIVAYALQTLAYLAISLTGSYPLLVAGMVAFGFGWGMRAVPSDTFFVENVDVRDRNLALSTYLSRFGVGQFLGSILAGALTTSVFPPLGSSNSRRCSSHWPSY